ncbi:protein EDS1L-like [Eucalyptus grandis]|uniref:protein EDS1L-like n=1 Tax=Eucalyptus grandis TaxID=71139 RepID=UPI00192EFF68|nr:protein EDS1L-like [Eucalyptus grandis]
MARFVRILEDSSRTLRKEVEKAKNENKQMIFTGHSSGGPIAIFATVWFLEEHKRSLKKEIPRVFCLTFASPLTTDRTFCHAIGREGWSDYFVHFVMKLDIIPRILLAPSSSVEGLLKEIHNFKNPHHKPILEDLIPSFVNVRKHASCVANYAACALTGTKHTLFDTMSRFIKLSPYSPCGKYFFCTETHVLVVVENPDAVLQLLFYSLHIKFDPELKKIAEESLKACWRYKDALDKSLAQPSVVSLDLQELPLSSNDDTLNDLNLGTSARLCLRAAGESEKKKLDNLQKIKDKMGTKNKALDALEIYSKGGYYDAFKLQKEEEDFRVNVKRLELADIWDEIIEMLRQEELPDIFEAAEEWEALGTRFRRLVEPIDIANYYRHSKDGVSGPYMGEGRPSRYKYTQRWREHAKQLPKGSCGESCFWAEVEELNLASANEKRQKALELKEKLKQWHEKGEIREDASTKDTALVKWLLGNDEAECPIESVIES